MPLGINGNGLGASKTVELWIKKVLINMITRKSNPERKKKTTPKQNERIRMK